MDERTRGVTGAEAAGGARDSGESEEASDSEKAAEQLEEKVDAIRDNLGNLVGELDRRRHRAAKPLMIGVAAIAGLVIAGGVAFFNWHRGRRPSRLTKFGQAIRRAVTNPDRVASEKPNATK